MIRYSIVVAMALAVVFPAAGRAAEIFLNKRGMTREGEWPFAVGGENLLEVRDVGEASSVRIALSAPDGTRSEAEARPGAPGVFAADLGPMLGGLSFSYKDGLVFASGYGVEISLLRDGKVTEGIQLQQVPSRRFVEWKYGDAIAGTTGCLAKDAPRSFRFNPARSVGTVVDFFLNDSVLLENGMVSVRAGLRPNAPADSMDFRFIVTDSAGQTIRTKPVKLSKAAPREIEAFSTSAWVEGEYRFRLEPVVDGRVFPDGPAFTYRRDLNQDGGLWISPMLPWRLPPRADAPSLQISLFSDDRVVLPAGWERAENSVSSKGSHEPLLIRPQLAGLYAVYVTPLDRGCLISVGSEKTVRACKLDTEQFVTVADLTGHDIRIYGFDWMEKSGRKTGLRSIRFEPVTAGAREMMKKMGEPEICLTGIDDWMEYFHGAARLQPDQISAILQGQQEVGLAAVAWSVGRSLVEYRSNLPTVTRFPAQPLASLEAAHPAVHAYKSREAMNNLLCPFRTALQDASEMNFPLQAWLGMNRHYGVDVLNGVFTSRWFAEHQNWRQWRKNAETPNRGEVCYYYPGVREERLAILNELVSLGADALTLDTTRQVPMLLYHPEMVEAYVKEFGRDPRTFGYENKEAYLHWIQWRSDFFTMLLRDLRKSTSAVGRRIAINLRVPQLDLVNNLAMGLDIRTWLREGLIDQLLLNPLETSQGEGLASTAEYQSLCEKYKVPLSVGVGATWMSRMGMAPGLARAAGLQAAGVTHMDLYEAEYLAFLTEARWVPAVMGSPTLMKEFQQRSNLGACYPILPETACNGLDNHARWLQSGWTLEGKGLNSL